MAKYYGEIGFVNFIESSPGVWSEQIVKKNYYGDVLQNGRRWQGSEHLNDDLTVSNRISILADPYATENFHAMRYVSWMGTKWIAQSVDVEYPRLTITLGGVYHGEEDED